MRGFFRQVEDFLRGRRCFAVGAPIAGRLRWLLLFVVVFGVFYGAVMASFTGLAPGRYHQLIYIGVKVPLLLLVTFGLCLPSFFVINTVVGLRDDFGEALQAVVATQSCVTVLLACLAPITAFFYLCNSSYARAILFNGLIFAVASITAQVVLRRYYAPLIQRQRTHRIMLYAWLLLYIFVAIQMAWVLRPFIGDPSLPVAFFRRGAWGNAYVVVAGLIADVFRSIMSW